LEGLPTQKAATGLAHAGQKQVIDLNLNLTDPGNILKSVDVSKRGDTHANVNLGRNMSGV